MNFRKALFFLPLIFLNSLFTLQAHVPDSLFCARGIPVLPLRNNFSSKSGPKSADTMIVSLLNRVYEDSIGATIEHLEDYVTRLCTSPQAFWAQDWIEGKLQSYGYTTSIQNLSQPAGSSGNVIATLTGGVYPTEYIVLGAHYDSYTGQDEAPGADDNASGTAGILEIARVLSQHSFERSIILCLWAAEEYGCYGSMAYASQAATLNMNILGYLNLDMCGYQYGDTVKTNVVGPSSAQALLDFYKAVCGIYLPSFKVTIGGNLPGSSDHASFNQAGYMGIFPFEDVDHYSPYIHTPDDLLGNSVNSLPMAAVFTRSVLATALELANQVPPPLSLTAMPVQQQIDLSWRNPGILATGYKVYRDDMINVYATVTDTFFTDYNVMNGVVYQYAVSLVKAQNGKESLKSNKVLCKAGSILSLPYYEDFENGLTWWMTFDSWNLTSADAHSPTTSLTDSPSGNYTNDENSLVYLIPFSLEGYNAASMSFWCKYRLENNYDFVYLEVSDGDEYEIVGTYTGNQSSWSQKAVNLNAYAGKPYVSVRFRILTDNWQVFDGFYVDDITISVPGVGIEDVTDRGWKINIMPNPFNGAAELNLKNSYAAQVKIEVFNNLGMCVAKLCDGVLDAGSHKFTIDGTLLTEGIYYYRLISGEYTLTGKIIKVTR